MVGRRADQRYPMISLHILMEIEHEGHAGMPAADQDQMLSHFPPILRPKANPIPFDGIQREGPAEHIGCNFFNCQVTLAGKIFNKVGAELPPRRFL